MGKEEWVGVTEVAKYLNVSRDSIYRWITKEKFPACQMGNLLRFKLSEVDKWATSNRPRRGRKASQENKDFHIFAVDDSALDRQAIRRLAKNEGHQFSEADNGSKALKLLKENKMTPDLIFLDLFMPEMDAADTLKHLRKSKKLQNIPVIILASHPESRRISKVLPFTPLTILAKPLKQKQLKESVALTLEGALSLKEAGANAK